MRSFKLATVFFIGMLTFGLQAKAQNIGFEDSKPYYQALKYQYETDKQSILETAESNVSTIDQQIQNLETDFQNCSTFDCRKEARRKIDQLVASKKDINALADLAVMEKAKVFVREAQEVLVYAFAIESLRMAAAETKLEHFVHISLTDCGPSPFSDYYINPSRAMTCKQMNVEFKYGDKFYRLSKAVGLAYNGYDHFGNSQPIDVAREVATINNVFSLTTTELMIDLDAVQLFFGGGMRQDWSQVIFDQYGRAQHYGMYSPFWVGLYTVSVESI